MELAEKGVNKLKEENPTEAAVDLVGTKQRKSKGREERRGFKGNQHGANKEPQLTNRSKFSKNNTNKRVNTKFNDIVCFRCGQAHFANSCTLPRSVKCRECGGLGHLQKVCKEKDQAHMLEEVCSVMEQEHLEHRAKFTVPLRVENQEVIFDVDCGSAVTLGIFDSGSRHRSEDNEIVESEEEGTAEANVPHSSTVEPNTSSHERQSTAIAESRPQRNRKPPSRYGNYLSSF
ncbi:uncharacterized protein LOC105278220 [Ooceraea biroi]|uniref:uncharacterized protein LOC105278220 n=1 Tax=Ooceraea biroi TaxID=2015173 RepID=UPI000F0833D9|nr:uncharacterized protein LOC105278220 [Ooceraea biroi]